LRPVCSQNGIALPCCHPVAYSQSVDVTTNPPSELDFASSYLYS
jgi:hypothetical protein